MRALLRQPAWWPAAILFLLLVAGLVVLAADSGNVAQPPLHLVPEERTIRVHVDSEVARPGAPSAPQPIAYRVDLNRASFTELMALPSIGTTRAKALIDARHSEPFTSLQDIVDRGLLPRSVAETLQPFVGVSP